MRISREQIINRLRAAGWKYTDKGKHTQMYRKPGSTRHVFVPLRDLFEEKLVRLVLGQAMLTKAQIDEFIEGASKT